MADSTRPASPTRHTLNLKHDSDITLFVKAGVDNIRYGACPFCHRIFMLLIIKGQLRSDLRFRVITVNPVKAPVEFRNQSLRRVPALVDGEVASDNIDDILQYLEDYYPTPALDYENREAVEACNNLFQKFCFYIKDVSKDGHSLMNELCKLDAYLAGTGWGYLCGKHVSQLDIEVWPKLHNIRVAARYLKDFVIPAQFKQVWRYMRAGYGCEAFVESCPSDQEIIRHWADKPDTVNLTIKQNAQLAKQEPVYSFDIPM